MYNFRLSTDAAEFVVHRTSSGVHSNHNHVNFRSLCYSYTVK